LKAPTSEIARHSRLFVLVADAQPERLDYRDLLPNGNVQWGFVSKPDIFHAALRLQPWDVILVDQSMIDSIPPELLITVNFQEDSHDLILLIEPDNLAVLSTGNLIDVCGYLLRDATLLPALARLLRRHLYTQALDRERQHLEHEISRILEQWEQSIRDRTDKLERTNRALQESDEMKSRFLANVSHQLRTPLTVIRSYTDLLMKCPPDAAQEHMEFLNIISTETSRLSRMIDDLLDLARLDANADAWNLTETNLRSLLQGIITTTAAVFLEHGITASLYVPDSLPMVRANAERLSQVINNLLLNSAEALSTIPPSVERTITITAEQVSEPSNDDAGEVHDVIRVHVDDSGPGIPVIDRQRVFNRFEQGPKHRTKTRGTGLGLAISREIIERHHGHIWADASPSGGCRITFTLQTSDLRMLSDAFSSEVLSVVPSPGDA
jgi:signal transduction histidine kinase